MMEVVAIREGVVVAVTDLPALYEAVVDKRPDLEVGPKTVIGTSLFWCGNIDEDGRIRDERDMGWHVGDDGFDAMLCGGPNAAIAAALIFDVWFKALPAFVRLYMTDGDIGAMPGPRKWLVEDVGEGKHFGLYPTPIEALAAFYLQAP